MRRTRLRRIITTGLVMLFCMGLSPLDVQAQCPMCRISAESNLRSGGTAGKGLNTGILFLLSLPYLMVGSLGYVWWRSQKQVHGDEIIP